MAGDDDRMMTGRFVADGSPLSDGPRWGMSLRAAGSMRFRWNEENPNRDAFLAGLCGGEGCTAPLQVAAAELIHSKTVFAVSSAEELRGMQGDGIITRSRGVLPVVTVADCMPVFLYEPVTGVFGVLHSGWKGTGIVREAILRAEREYGARRERFCVVLGPHIRDCCYEVDADRAGYFSANFSADCVRPLARPGGERFRLSLEKANLAVLDGLGVPRGNVSARAECTCCDGRFGSFRRETAGLPPEMPLAERQKRFTVQAAWVRWEPRAESRPALGNE